MPIQPERKLFPQILPAPPRTEEDVLQWAIDFARNYQDYSKQMYDVFNAHVDQTHGHPKSWTKWKIPRPAYSVDGTHTVTVAASASVPVYFLVGGTLLEATSNLTCNMSTTGVGGLDTGTIASNKIYYLYGIKNSSGAAALIASLNAPTTGPTGYSDWTYIGGVPSYYSAANTVFGRSDQGVYLSQDGGFDIQTTTSTTPVAKTILVPANAAAVYARLDFSVVGGSNDIAYLRTDSGKANAAITRAISTAPNDTSLMAWVPIFTSQTIYLHYDKVSGPGSTARVSIFGFREDPTVYK